MGYRLHPCRNPTTGRTGAVDHDPCWKHKVVAPISLRYDAANTQGTPLRHMLAHMAACVTLSYAFTKSTCARHKGVCHSRHRLMANIATDIGSAH